MQVATWNINSIRTRLPQVIQWLQAHTVDVLCLQETKVIDADFPQQAFADIGYQAHVYGQKAYNGVALISRGPLHQVRRGFAAVLGPDQVGDLDDQKRVISAVVENVCIVNLYVPNGASVGSEKYAYKLRWLHWLRSYLAQRLREYPHLHVCGDFNIALEDRDIYDASDKANHIMASAAERQTLQRVLEIGLQDALRKFTTEPGQFSWWDYRAASFRRNLGWRIDHHYLSDSLYERATSCTIDVEPRKLEKPSDHAPVIVEYSLPER